MSSGWVAPGGRSASAPTSTDFLPEAASVATRALPPPDGLPCSEVYVLSFSQRMGPKKSPENSRLPKIRSTVSAPALFVCAPAATAETVAVKSVAATTMEKLETREARMQMLTAD